MPIGTGGLVLKEDDRVDTQMIPIAIGRVLDS
jgi:hypothetical protein